MDSTGRKNTRRELPKGWHNDVAQFGSDLAKISPRAPLHTLAAVDTLSPEIPAFRGRSSRLLSKPEACAELSCSLSHLDKQLREGMIFPDLIGRHVRIPIEECQNYRDRERLRYRVRHA